MDGIPDSISDSEQARIGIGAKTELRPLAVPAIALGIALTLAALISLPWLPHWAAEGGPLLVYAALVLHLAIAAGLIRWGLDILLTERRNR
ncbi:hypothetical protein D5S18_27485 [Nocardia panacis]|uniref:Uncharacterized protein n=1 Tax=Nocardia panacis TaxID=2340916 RepID=A0A3A4K0U7_9NOCA|nr:hypothetical protein [Nocardia panacis]RJO70923.1 hypothetical protein D5S18_27485 [Nocardia panacis]